MIARDLLLLTAQVPNTAWSVLLPLLTARAQLGETSMTLGQTEWRALGDAESVARLPQKLLLLGYSYRQDTPYVHISWRHPM